MYKLTIKNNSPFVIAPNGNTLDPGMDYTYPDPLGTTSFDVPGFGSIAIVDIGDKKVIDNPLKQTWKVVIAYQGEAVIFGYEGEGELTLNFNEVGTAEISCNGEVVLLRTPAFDIPGEVKMENN